MTEITPDRVTAIDDPSRSDMIWLDDQLNQFNVMRSGHSEGRWLAIFVRDHHQRIVAGLYGWTWGGTCELKTFWIHERHRRRGLGTRMLQAVEAEARARGATQIVLDTHSFQAPDFYRRFGFERVGAVTGYPTGYEKIFLRKLLVI